MIIKKRLGKDTIKVDTDTLRAGHYSVVLPNGKAVKLARTVVDLLPDVGRPPKPDDERLQRRWVSLPPAMWDRIDREPEHHRLTIHKALQRYFED